MAIQLLQHASNPRRTPASCTYQAENLLELEKGSASLLNDQEVGSESANRSFRLRDRGNRCRPDARHLVADATGQSAILAEQDRGKAVAALQASGNLPDPVARLTVAAGQLDKLDSLSAKAGQGGQEHW
jgi:hypothetical protein